jgi:N-acetylmuramoyl-L-alanine amidase
MAESYTVKAGDTLASIAHRFGFRSWQTIYDDPSNGDLKKKRPNPMVLAPGDVVQIPDKRPREVACETNKRHTFRLKPLLVDVVLNLANSEGEPFAEKRYVLLVDGKRYEGKTDGNGTLRQSVPPTATEGEVTVWKRDDVNDHSVTWKLKFGFLEPHDSNKGVKARLQNLGYSVGDCEKDDLDEPTKAAIKEFQTSAGLKVTGDLDDETKNKLKEAYRGV